MLKVKGINQSSSNLESKVLEDWDVKYNPIVENFCNINPLQNTKQPRVKIKISARYPGKAAYCISVIFLMLILRRITYDTSQSSQRDSY